MNTLSVCMIVKNEELVLARCLDCVKTFADEIIITDTGSTDSTKQIAHHYTDLVFEYAWCDDFAAARNFSFSKSSCKYTMWLDADDVISPENCQKLNLLKHELENENAADMIFCRYVLGDSFKYERERIVKTASNFVWQERVHECIVPRGQILHTAIEIQHKKEKPTTSKRNLKIYRKMEREMAEFTPRALYYYGRELYFNQIYHKALRILNKFLKTDGWIENKIDACVILSQIYSILAEPEKAKIALFTSFTYDIPRAKPCYLLGNLYFNQQNYNIAKFWYKAALFGRNGEQGFIETEFSGISPALQLCVTCYQLGQTQAAVHYHEICKKLAPNNPNVIKNESFFIAQNLIKTK